MMSDVESTARWLKWAGSKIRHLINVWWWDETSRHPELLEELKASYQQEYADLRRMQQ